MQEASQRDNIFLKRVNSLILEHISDEQFGVSELAEELAMSRSNLLRKIKSITDLSVSQYIRQVRLEHAMAMIKEGSLTVSEISFKVGFGSTSYFIKCFGDQFGYPPGEVGKMIEEKEHSIHSQTSVPTHQLAAIMFTDIEGYTALMQKDEDKAIEIRNRHRTAFETITGKYEGKILQYYGDGTLSTFQSAIQAVRCGIELQLAFLDDPKIPVRIGIHTGDIIVSDDGIIGDGVNVASRVESLASAGSVFISEKVFDEVKNQSGIQATSVGVFDLKNVEKPVEVYAITNSGLVVPEKQDISGKIILKTAATKGTGKVSDKKKWLGVLATIVLLIAAGYLMFSTGLFEKTSIEGAHKTIYSGKKSIAVLPFINDSNDSTNTYFVNGLMESILNNLQKINDLRVISRTSVEKYRINKKTAREIAEELEVAYIVEGSGQKIGDQVLLTIQLIDARNDTHLWAEQYDREMKDIFEVQKEVATQIASEIEVIITPAEQEQIEKLPTENMEAYDYFLKGLELMYRADQESLDSAVLNYKKAIALDPNFARAYANIAVSYHFMDAYQKEKSHSEEIRYYSDKAVFLDPELPHSLIAKALYYINVREYMEALPYLERALELQPNSTLILNILSFFYTNYYPDSEKYLKYALRALQLDLASKDSIEASFTLLHVSNAFIQSGFSDEALHYINKSIDYHPENLFSEYVKAYILYTKNKDLDETGQLLKEALSKDPTRLDIMQEVAKIHYIKREYDSSYHYYSKFLKLKENLGLEIYTVESSKIGTLMQKMGKLAEAREQYDIYRKFAQQDNSLYRHMNLAMMHVIDGNFDKAIEELKIFSEEDSYHYWLILFFDIDPIVDDIKDNLDYKRVMSKIEMKFWKRHDKIRKELEKDGLLL